MAFYKTCPLCGSNLDPGESCDCQEEKEQDRRKAQSMMKVGRDGQMQMCFAGEVAGIAEVGA